MGQRKIGWIQGFSVYAERCLEIKKRNSVVSAVEKKYKTGAKVG